MASVVPITVRDGDGDPVESVRASYADYVWGVPPEDFPIYPILGLSTREVEEEDLRSVIDVAEESVAERAGFQAGDVLLTLDGEPMATKGDISAYMAGKRWGDSGWATVRREGEEVGLELHFRRTLDDDAEEDAQEEPR
jgi:membrane-associated protease RseP (regulator of RpoE activity)